MYEIQNICWLKIYVKIYTNCGHSFHSLAVSQLICSKNYSGIGTDKILMTSMPLSILLIAYWFFSWVLIILHNIFFFFFQTVSSLLTVQQALKDFFCLWADGQLCLLLWYCCFYNTVTDVLLGWKAVPLVCYHVKYMAFLELKPTFHKRCFSILLVCPMSPEIIIFQTLQQPLLHFFLSAMKFPAVLVHEFDVIILQCQHQ